jgi:hypothetical protein
MVVLSVLSMVSSEINWSYVAPSYLPSSGVYHLVQVQVLINYKPLPEPLRGLRWLIGQLQLCSDMEEISLRSCGDLHD